MYRTAAITTLLLSFGIGCSHPDQPVQPEQSAANTTSPEATMTEGDLRYVAETTIVGNAPVQFTTTVTATNTGSQPATITFPDGCPVLLRAYRAPERTGTPAWDQANDTVCTMAIQRFTIEPGQSHTFERRADANEILGNSRPNGRYYLTAVLRKTGGALALAAGTVDLTR